jgi:hypothetical protein
MSEATSGNDAAPRDPFGFIRAALAQEAQPGLKRWKASLIADNTLAAGLD